MRRFAWVALLSVCAACSAPPDDGDDQTPTNGAGKNSTVTEPAAAPDLTASAGTLESTEATDPAEAVTANETKAPSNEALESSDVPDSADPADRVAPADSPAAADSSAASNTDSTAPDKAAAAIVAKDVLGIVAEKPAEGPFVETNQGFMVPYKMQIPGTEVEFEMVPIPGGTFTMGSPKSEEKRGENEGPQVQLEVAPFWMAKYELTWSEYRAYMGMVDIFIDFMGRKMRLVTDDNRCDAVSAPSNLYDPSMTFKNGEEPRQPAATMTPFGARQYTKWLSRLTGQVYRLPTEAEWEYACRAGSETAYFFGNDKGDLGDYAWYAENSDETTHEVGQKKPNAWGLYDMYGNVAEMVIDEYRENAYAGLKPKSSAAAAVAWPTDYDFRVYRGGNYDDFEEDCRSAGRRATEGDDWKIDDPNEPKSPWWYSDAPSLGVGFRLVRPLVPPSADELARVWDAAVEDVQDSAQQRISEGRGAWGLVDPALPGAIVELEKIKAGG